MRAREHITAWGFKERILRFGVTMGAREHITAWEAGSILQFGGVVKLASLASVVGRVAVDVVWVCGALDGSGACVVGP